MKNIDKLPLYEADAWTPIERGGANLPNKAGNLRFFTHTGVMENVYFSNDRQCLNYYADRYSHFKEVPVAIVEYPPFW